MFLFEGVHNFISCFPRIMSQIPEVSFSSPNISPFGFDFYVHGTAI